MQLNLNKINSWEDEKCHSLFRTMGDIQRQVDIECLLQKQSNGLPPNQIGTIVPNEVTHSFPINRWGRHPPGSRSRCRPAVDSPFGHASAHNLHLRRFGDRTPNRPPNHLLEPVPILRRRVGLRADHRHSHQRSLRDRRKFQQPRRALGSQRRICKPIVRNRIRWITARHLPIRW